MNVPDGNIYESDSLHNDRLSKSMLSTSYVSNSNENLWLDGAYDADEMVWRVRKDYSYSSNTHKDGVGRLADYSVIKQPV
jgi:hypothetical protein